MGIHHCTGKKAQSSEEPGAFCVDFARLCASSQIIDPNLILVIDLVFPSPSEVLK